MSRLFNTSAAAAVSNEIVAAVAGKVIRVLTFSATVSAATSLKWQSAAVDVTGPAPLVLTPR